MTRVLCTPALHTSTKHTGKPQRHKYMRECQYLVVCTYRGIVLPILEQINSSVSAAHDSMAAG